MKRNFWLFFTIMVAGTFAAPTSASAQTLNYLGRFFGVGWSDGYHARDHLYQHRGDMGPTPNVPSTPYYAPPPGLNYVPPPHPNMQGPARNGADMPAPGLPRYMQPGAGNPMNGPNPAERAPLPQPGSTPMLQAPSNRAAMRPEYSFPYPTW